MTYFLFADSVFAKTFQGPHGPDILVGDDTRIGRSVTGRDSCRLPAKWAQVSGSHCKIFYTSLKVFAALRLWCTYCMALSVFLFFDFVSNRQEPAGYWIEDTSTNGTLVNGQRVAKHASVPLAEGDKVQLSFNAGGDENVLL